MSRYQRRVIYGLLIPPGTQYVQQLAMRRRETCLDMRNLHPLATPELSLVAGVGGRFLSPLVGSLFAAITDKVLMALKRLVTVSNARLIPPRSAQSLSTHAPNIAVASIVSEKLA